MDGAMQQQQQSSSSPPSGTHHAYDDELPKQLPEQSDVERQHLLRRVHEEQKSNTRFPLNMFVDCVGADGIRIMGRSAPPGAAAAAAAAVAAGKHRRKYPPLSRERLEAFLAMTREQHSKSVVMGAVTWDHGTVMFPLGDDYDLVAGFDGGSSKGGGAAAAAAATSGAENDGTEKQQRQPPKRNTPPQPTAEEIAAAREQQRQRLQERRMRIQNGNLLPPPPPVSFSLRIGRGVGGNNDDDGSEVSSPTFAPTDSEFPATATATSRESAHSSDIARADAVAIEAAMRGLNPMSAQAAMLRAAAIHRREQRLKRRVEQSIILSNLERHEKYGLAEIPAVAAAAGGNARSAAALPSASALGGMHTPSTSNSPGGVGLPSGGGSGAFPANVSLPHGSGTPSKTYLAGNAGAAANNSNGAGMSLKRESSSPTGGGRLGMMPRVGSRSSIGDATEASSMPELMSATPSEAGLSRVGVPSPNGRKQQQMPPTQGASSSSAAVSSSAAPFATTTTTATMGGGSRSSPETPNSKIAARAQQPQQQQNQSTTDARRPPPPPFAEQARPAAHSSTAPFVKPGANAAAAAAIPATASSDSKQQEEDGKSKSNSGDDNDDEQVAAAVGAAAGGCGLTSKDLQRLQRQEGTQMRSRVSVEDFGAAKGRGVRSNGVFAPGALIFRVRPDIGVLYSDHVKHHCAHCFRPSIEGRSVLSSSAAAQHVCLASCDKLVCCPFCECFALCRDCGGVPDLASLEPQSAPVPDGGGGAGGPPPHPSLPHLWHRHMLWCRWLRTLPAGVRAGDTDYLRFLLEYAARVQHGDARLVESISTLCALEEAQSAEVKSFCDSFSALVSNTFAPKGLVVSRAALREALLRIKCNALGFPFTREATLGWATHSSVCMLNHSCAPAAALTQSPLGEMEVRAVKDIAPAEEVTISYLDLSLPEFKSAKERRRELLTKYLFFCRCPRCTENK